MKKLSLVFLLPISLLNYALSVESFVLDCKGGDLPVCKDHLVPCDRCLPDSGEIYFKKGKQLFRYAPPQGEMRLDDLWNRLFREKSYDLRRLLICLRDGGKYGFFANILNLEDRKINISGAMFTSFIMLRRLLTRPLKNRHIQDKIVYVTYTSIGYLTSSLMAYYTNLGMKNLYKKYKEWRDKREIESTSK